MSVRTAAHDGSPIRRRFEPVLGISVYASAKATDISGIDTLPIKGVPKAVTPVSKAMWLDFLYPRFGLAKDMPVKLEGLTFGPDLPDGRHLLLVTVDNDFLPEVPTTVYAFAVGRNDLPGYMPQVFGR